MTIRTIEPEQHRAAKVVGFLYLFTMATAIFGELYVRGQLIVRGDAVQTATNIAASERLFRLGIVSDLITFAGVVMLVWALYVVLSAINRNLALLAAFLRLVAISIAAASVVNAFVALRLLSGTAYLHAFDTQQLQVLARLFISGQGFGSGIDFVFLGLGSTVFSYLWFKSRYIPRALAALGIFGSLMLAIGGLAIMVFPSLADVLTLTYMMPLGIFEVTLGLWLLFKGVRAPVVG
jgi:hypothetical protein